MSRRKSGGIVAGVRGAFTLIELLVVIAIIALLISILLPALQEARDVARAIVCSSSQRQYGIGQASYANDWKGFMAGVNTSGAEVQFFSGGILGNTDGSNPTSSFDWISPIMGTGAGLSPNRAQRTAQIFKTYGCPSAREQSVLFGSAADSADFNAVLGQQGFGQVSHLAPASFHLMPSSAEASKQGNKYRGVITLKFDPFEKPGDVPDRYRHNEALLGVQPSNKVLAADGTRYFEPSTKRLDFDVAPSPNQFGSFTDSGPIFRGSTAYGASFAGAPTNVNLSFRHPSRTIRAVYYDGHVGVMKTTEAWKDAAPWYPGGTVFKTQDATPESVAFHKPDEILP